MEQCSLAKRSSKGLRLEATNWRKEAENYDSPNKDIYFEGKIQTG